MNIKKTNPLSLIMIENHTLYKSGTKLIDEHNEKSRVNINGNNRKEHAKRSVGVIDYNMTCFSRHSENETKIRVSKSIIESCKLINFDSISKSIEDLEIKDTVIMLTNDDLGFIRIKKVGCDLNFIWFQNLDTSKWGEESLKCDLNTFSFLTKEFFLEPNENHKFVIKLLSYLFYGDITKRHIPPKTKVKTGKFSNFLNNSKYNIIYADSLWKQRISTYGFKVSGHFRLQPCGKGSTKRKLIWIEEFNKNGYNRKATKELKNN